MRTIAKVFFLVFMLIPSYGFAFDMARLDSCKGVAVKTLVLSDTLADRNKSKASEIRNIKNMEQIFGKEKSRFKGEYVFLGRSEPVYSSGKATWYNFNSKSKKPKPNYRLYYSKNKVMKSANIGDLLVVCKKDSANILLLVAQKDSADEKEILKYLNLRKPSDLQKDENKLEKQSKKLDTSSDFNAVNNDELPDLPNITISNKSFTRRYYAPGPDCENNIIAEFNNSKKSVDIAVYAINNQRIFEALEYAHNRGVKIRVITDRTES